MKYVFKEFKSMLRSRAFTDWQSSNPLAGHEYLCALMPSATKLVKSPTIKNILCTVGGLSGTN
jgi:hypothetical protein